MEYWLARYGCAMGSKERIDTYTSNPVWTRTNIERVTSGEFPQGMTAANILVAFVCFVRAYYPAKEKDVKPLLFEYIRYKADQGESLKKSYQGIRNLYVQRTAT